MPKYIIERTIRGAGQLSPLDLAAISQKSCDVLAQMGPHLQWLESYVSDDKVYCVYIAPDEAGIREHARRGGFPIDRIMRIRSVIDPTTAETWSVQVKKPAARAKPAKSRKRRR